MKYLVQPLVPESAAAPGPQVNNNRVYSITAVYSGKAMTVGDYSNIIVQKTWAEEDRQRWKIEFLRSSSVPSGIDAIFNWESHNKAYFFKGNSYVGYDVKNDRTDSGYPAPIVGGNWPDMPSNFCEDIDAILYWSKDQAYFFKGSEYVKYNLKEDRAESGYPRPIKGNWSGMPDNFCEGIDAVFQWDSDRAYFFKGSQYVRYNIKKDQVETDYYSYPVSIKGKWSGMPDDFCEDIDAVFKWDKDRAYFFKGEQYLRYNLKEDKVETDYSYPASTKGNWSGIPPFFYSPVLQYEVRIISVASGEVIGVSGGSNDDSFAIVAQDGNGSDYQKWILEPLGHTGYKIRSKGSGKLVQVYGSSHTEGTAIIQYHHSTGQTNQHWVFSDVKSANLFNERSILYKDGNYSGKIQEVGPGSYNLSDLVVGNDTISSVKVGAGMRVTLFADSNFKGKKKMFVKDTDWVGDDFNDKTSSVLVEKVVTLYKNGDYGGTSTKLGIGRYRMADIAVGNNALSSMKIPQGLMAIAYEYENFAGNYKVFFEDTPWLGDYSKNDVFSSIIIKASGIVIPKKALNFGDTISLKSYDHDLWMSGGDNGSLWADNKDQGWEKFIVVRAGDTRHTRLVSYGDIVALENAWHKKYVTASSSGSANANQDKIGEDEKFVVVRIGDTQSKHFVAQGDGIALKSAHNTYLCIDESISGSRLKSNVKSNKDRRTYWKIDSYTNNYPYGDKSFGTSITPNDTEKSLAAACGEDVGWVTFCAVNACGAAACGAAGAFIAACGAAAVGIGICQADFAVAAACGGAACYAALGGIGVCGAAACGAALGGLGACGGDVCGLAACGAAACGGAACGAAACGADACGAAASGVGGNLAGACAVEVGGVDACVVDVCAANACGINLCPADACVADACFIDIAPVIPLI